MFWNYELKIVAHYTDSPAIVWDFLQPRLEDLFEKSDMKMKMETWDLKIAKS